MGLNIMIQIPLLFMKPSVFVTDGLGHYEIILPYTFWSLSNLTSPFQALKPETVMLSNLTLSSFSENHPPHFYNFPGPTAEACTQNFASSVPGSPTKNRSAKY